MARGAWRPRPSATSTKHGAPSWWTTPADSVLSVRPSDFPAARSGAMLSARPANHGTRREQGGCRARCAGAVRRAAGSTSSTSAPAARPALSVLWQALLGRAPPQAELPEVRRRTCRGRRAPPPDQGRLCHAQGMPGGDDQGTHRRRRAHLRRRHPRHRARVSPRGVAADHQGHVRQTTYASYRASAETHIIPRLGSLQLQKLTRLGRSTASTPTCSRRDASEGEGGLSAASVRRVHAALRRACRDAVRWGRLTANPAACADPPKVSAEHDEQSVWTAEQLSAFLASVARRSSLCPLAAAGHDRHAQGRGAGPCAGRTSTWSRG